MPSQHDKAVAFRALHARAGAFVIPNPWDAGTACLLARMGFEALATTSAGAAFSLGRPDGAISRDEALANAAAVAAATDLPVSADLESCYGDDSQAVAETIARAAATGLIGGSIEDTTGRREAPIYELDVAVERVRAAVAAARRLPFPFTLTARAENFLWGRPDLADTIRRLQAFAAAGADVLYAPGLRTRDDIAAVVRAVDRPVNVIMGLQGARFSVAELAALGVRRISVGSALARAALGAVLRAGREMREAGTFTFADAAAPFGEINAAFAARSTHVP